MPKEIAAESHHRVKNTLQSIVALVSILSGAKGHLDKNDVRRLLTHVHNLSSLHDALYEAVLSTTSWKELNIESVCSKILGRFGCLYNFTGTFLTTPRIVSTVSLILSDIMTALEMQSARDIECNGACEGESEYKIEFIWSADPHPDSFLTSSGLQLAKLVLSSEIQGLFYQIPSEQKNGALRHGIGFVIRRHR